MLPAKGPSWASSTPSRTSRALVAKNVHHLRTDMMSEEESTEYGELLATIEGTRLFARKDVMVPASFGPLDSEARAA